MIHLPPDFKEFLRSLNSHHVDYLLVDGYAVGYHGYPRATVDMDVWVKIDVENARRVVAAIEDFGFGSSKLTAEMFLEDDQIIRMGLPPMRIEVLTSISGVAFEQAHAERVDTTLDGIEVPVISLRHLKVNKSAAARAKDLADLEQLP